MQRKMTKEAFVARVLSDRMATRDAETDGEDFAYREQEELRRIAESFRQRPDYEINGYQYDLRKKWQTAAHKRRKRGRR